MKVVSEGNLRMNHRLIIYLVAVTVTRIFRVQSSLMDATD